MAAHKHIDKICCGALVLTLVLSLCLMSTAYFGGGTANAALGYENRIFDTDRVHRIDIVMNDWDDFIASCMDEEYVSCSVIIDGEAYRNVGIRAKGNTSLTQVESYGNNRYSFKIEFDHYDDSLTYHGLDKLCLNNLIQDNTYMKDYLVYRMMGEMGVAAPLCSYVSITVNGEPWGLYLAVEGVEESFLRRNYGNDYGELYKPDSSDMGGGRGNGRWFEGSDTADSDASLIYTDDLFESYVNLFNNAKTNPSDADKERLIAAIRTLNVGEEPQEAVDIEQVIRYFAVHNFVLNFDSYTGSMIHNYYLYEDNGKLSMIPWDYNLAFGGFMSVGDAESLINYPIDEPVSGGTVASRPMLSWILSDEEYTARYHACLAELTEDYFESGVFEQMLDQTRDLIAPYVEEDATAFCSYEAFETGVATLKEFCLLRAESIKEQLDGSIASDSTGSMEVSASVSAEGIQISDMGSMDMAFGGGGNEGFGGGRGNDNGEFEGGRGPGNGDFGDMAPPDSDFAPPDENFIPEGDFTPPEDFTPPDDDRAVPAMGNFDAREIERAENAGTMPAGLLPLGISVAVLAAGLLIAWKFKRRSG